MILLCFLMKCGSVVFRRIQWCRSDLFCCVVTQALLSQDGAVEPLEQQLDLQQLVLQQLQADDSVQVSVILLLQQRHVVLQLGQPLLQTQQQTLEVKGLQGEHVKGVRTQKKVWTAG